MCLLHELMREWMKNLLNDENLLKAAATLSLNRDACQV